MKLKIFDDEMIKKWMSENKKFLCFGAGKRLQNLCERTGMEQNITWVADNNPDLWGKTYRLGNEDVPIISPEQMKPAEKNEIFLLTTTYHMQVKEQLENIPGWGLAYYFSSRPDKAYNKLAFIWKRLKPQNKLAFRSGLGSYVEGFDFSDNARVLFDYMIAHNYNKKYKLIWFVHDPDEFREFQNIPNVKFISYQWEKSTNLKENIQYYYHLCTSKYLFLTDTHFWLRYCNKGQIRVNLWHGCGFKDRKTKNGPCGRNYDYMTVTSPLYADIHAEEFGVEREKIIDTGLAKQDLLFQPPKESLTQLLGIKEAGKYVFWLPTFRMAAEGLERLNEYQSDSETGLPIIDTTEKAEKLNCLLAELDISMVIKLHPVQQNSIISHLKLSNIVLLENKDIFAMGLQINTLLSKADALISDYSSVAVDYMLLDRPIAFMLEDVEQYQQSRGFVFENIYDYLPGEELYTYDDLEKFLTDVVEERDSTKEKRRNLIEKMHTHCDGNNCKRILERIGLYEQI